MSFAALPLSGPVVLADLLASTRTRTRSAVLVLAGAALVGLAAQVAVPLPGTPVPFTLQTLAVLVVGAGLGARLGGASLALYALAGAAGMPWFADGSSGLVFASAGYVLGFVPAAVLVGWCAERRGDRTVLRTTATMLLGTAVVYACGVSVLMHVTGLHLVAALEAGVRPFLVGDAVKIAVASALLPSAWRLLDRR
jgi:biotin transport system substrate-specific component